MNYMYFARLPSIGIIKIIVLMKGDFNEKSCIIALIYYSMYYHDHIQ